MEIVLFVMVAMSIGFWWTLVLMAATTVIGVSLVFSQGRGQLARATASFRQGMFPGTDLADTVLLAVAGLLLVLPGFLTDAVGFALLAEPVRRTVRRIAGWQIGRRVRVW